MSCCLHWWHFPFPSTQTLEEAWAYAAGGYNQYLGSAVDVIRVSLLTLQQCDMCDVLHRISQSQKDLALLERFRNHSSRSNCAIINCYCKHLHLLQLIDTFKNSITSSQWMINDHPSSIRKAPMPCKTLNIRNTYFGSVAEILIPHLLFFRHRQVLVMPIRTAIYCCSDKYMQCYSGHSLKTLHPLNGVSGALREQSSHHVIFQKDPTFTAPGYVSA